MRAGRCGAEGKRVKAMMMMKTKKVKLYGEKLRKLNTAIHERDNNCCIICGKYVDPNEKFHHEPCGAMKSDEISKGVTLCYATLNAILAKTVMQSEHRLKNICKAFIVKGG